MVVRIIYEVKGLSAEDIREALYGKDDISYRGDSLGDVGQSEIAELLYHIIDTTTIIKPVTDSTHQFDITGRTLDIHKEAVGYLEKLLEKRLQPINPLVSIEEESSARPLSDFMPDSVTGNDS